MNCKLSDLGPKIVWSLFEDILKIPRCSGEEEKLQLWIKNWAEDKGISFKRDGTGNILLTLEATSGFERFPTLILQAHMDMVCVKTVGSSHNFDIDPIPVKIDGDTVKADGTSLGADNGIGIAIALAVLSESDLGKHGKIEVLLTVEEETGLIGAIKMQKEFFTGKRMLNLDSEEEGIIIVGSAGGRDTHYTIPTKFEDVESWKGYRIEISGLMGGHSGIDIHLPRINSNKLLGEGLKAVQDEASIRIMDIQGGSRINSIARSASCDFIVPERESENILDVLEDWEKNIDRSIENELKISFNAIPVGNSISEEDTASVIGIITEVHQGPVSWSEDIEGLVETSNNLGLVRTDENRIMISVSSRSSDMDELSDVQLELKKLGEKYGVVIEQPEGYPGWKADLDSPFLKLVVGVYEEVLDKEPEIQAIHAGLECGVLSRLDLDLKIVSIGPTIQNAHSPSESLDIESVGVVWRVVKKVIEELCSE